MRLAATLIASAALLVSACTLEPRSQADMRAELDKLNGPEPTSMEGSLKQQADQAAAAGDFRRAAQIYQQMADRKPENADYAVGLADALRRSGDCAGAIKATAKVLAAQPQHAAAMETRALCLMAGGEVPEASRLFEQVLAIDNTRWRSLNAVGILFTTRNMLPQAIQYFEEALKHSQDNPSVLNNLGLAYAIDKQFDKSVSSLQQARQMAQQGSAEERSVALNLALVHGVMGNLDAAEQTASPYLSKAALYNNMGFYAYLAKNRDLAKGYLNMALTQSPVYYERAWKNLTAIDESAASSGKLKAGKAVKLEPAAPAELREPEEGDAAKPAAKPAKKADKAEKTAKKKGDVNTREGEIALGDIPKPSKATGSEDEAVTLAAPKAKAADAAEIPLGDIPRPEKN